MNPLRSVGGRLSIALGLLPILVTQSNTMPTIRIPQQHWGKVWRALVASGPISRIGEEPVYQVSNEQLFRMVVEEIDFRWMPRPCDPSWTHPFAAEPV